MLTSACDVGWALHEARTYEEPYRADVFLFIGITVHAHGCGWG